MGIVSLNAFCFWLQVQHLLECERILSNLLEKTSETHRDYAELAKVVSKFKQVCQFGFRLVDYESYTVSNT